MVTDRVPYGRGSQTRIGSTKSDKSPAALDRLVDVDQGRTVEEGSLTALVASMGPYARLWAHQSSGGFLAEDVPDID